VLVDQSMLTGESAPVEANRGDIAYAGALVRRGHRPALDGGCWPVFSRIWPLAISKPATCDLDQGRPALIVVFKRKWRRQ